MCAFAPWRLYPLQRLTQIALRIPQVYNIQQPDILSGDALGQVLDEHLLQGRGVGADELVDLLAVLEDDEGGHGADAELLGELGQGVDVELGEVDLVLELALGPLGDLGRDGLAGAAPRREGVEHHHLVLGDGLLELVEAVCRRAEVLVPSLLSFPNAGKVKLKLT
jgi:hypothetical protein